MLNATALIAPAAVVAANANNLLVHFAATTSRPLVVANAVTRGGQNLSEFSADKFNGGDFLETITAAADADAAAIGLGNELSHALKSTSESSLNKINKQLLELAPSQAILRTKHHQNEAIPSTMTIRKSAEGYYVFDNITLKVSAACYFNQDYR